MLRIGPRPMLYLHFSTVIEGSSLRVSMRVKIGMPAQVTGSAPDPQPIHYSSLNIFEEEC